uniref:Uncharacterized protein n=3 Tax=Knipowitschia caucasica TaxID=637954 RepID=A0AAV2IZU1_KNICA
MSSNCPTSMTNGRRHVTFVKEQRLKVAYHVLGLIRRGADESRMDIFDDATVSVLEAAGVDEEALKGLSREDLKDLFPGPGHFLRRKKLWEFINQNCENTTDQDASTCSGSGIMPSTSSMPPCQPQASTPISAEKTMKMPDPPEYVVYTDSELDMTCKEHNH